MIPRPLFFLILGSVYASAIACIDLNSSLENKVNALIKKSYPNITFEVLEIKELNTNNLDGCDYVKFEMPEKINIQNDFILKLDAYKDDKFIKRHTKIYRFDGQVNILKTVKVAERGDQVSLKLLKKDVTSIHNITKHTVSHFPNGNTMFRNYVSSNEILESWMLEPIPDVSKGEIVKAVVKKQNITLTLDGRVLENGIIGDSIKLKLNEKIVIGKLQDEKTVIINSI
jgi:flagella basal body P-ring formation protein FlgA